MYEAFKELPDSDRLKVYDSLFEYALNDTSFPDEYPTSLLHIIKSQMDGNIKSYESFDMRVSAEYRKWKNAVYKRCGKECCLCGAKKDLEVHHIIPFSEDPEKRFDVDNGMILCKYCHRKVHERS